MNETELAEAAKEWAKNIGRGSFECSQRAYECRDHREVSFQAGADYGFRKAIEMLKKSYNLRNEWTRNLPID